jgi:hypothetical protein
VNTTALYIMAWITYLLTCNHVNVHLLIRRVYSLKRTNMNDRLKDFTDYCTILQVNRTKCGSFVVKRNTEMDT